MKVLRVQSTDIDLRVIDEKKRRFSTISPVVTKIFTDCGTFTIVAQKDTEVDGRSGGWFADLILPNVGDKYWRNVWFPHDMIFAHASYCDRNGMIPSISFELGNELFYQIGVLPKRLGGGGQPKWKMKIARRGVDSRFGRKAYETTDKTDRMNSGKITIRWDAE